MLQNLRPCCSRLVGLAVLYLMIIHILATSNAKPLITTHRSEPENEPTHADLSSDQPSPTIVIGSTDDLGSTPATNQRGIAPWIPPGCWIETTPSGHQKVRCPEPYFTGVLGGKEGDVSKIGRGTGEVIVNPLPN